MGHRIRATHCWFAQRMRATTVGTVGPRFPIVVFFGKRECRRVSERSCRKLVYERSEQFCERCCNGSRPLSVHHRKKRSQGGLWTAENCVLLCGHGTRGCHGWVEHNPAFAHADGFHVRPWEEPCDRPLHWRKTRWVYLMENGSMIDV